MHIPITFTKHRFSLRIERPHHVGILASIVTDYTRVQ